ncbi:MAG TPA: hypothetical protein V6D15_25415 [Oculatellaceae cyanobacterium]|jgi:hypothetical protein
MTSMELNDLQALGQILQERLQSDFQQMVPFKVRCVFKEGTLVILAQHPIDVVPDPQQTFRVLQQTLQTELTEYTLPVRLYLRVQGSQQPYNWHKFMLEPAVVSMPTGMAMGATGNEDTDFENPFALGEDAEIHNSWTEILEPSSESMTDDRSDEEWGFGQRLNAGTGTKNFEEQSIYESGETDNLSDETPESLPLKGWRPSLPLLVGGVSISMAVFLSSLYALTRPCVVGACEEITAAQRLNQNSATTLDQAKTKQEVLVAKQQLTEAQNILATIPWWSSEHEKAQKLIAVYQADSDRLDQVTQGLEKANIAAIKSKNPPHELSEWLEIQKLWNEAIAVFKQVPETSNVYQLAQRKLQDYQLSLAMVNQQVASEQKGNNLLATAKETVEIAKARQGVAQSLDDLQLVRSTWQRAFSRLNVIPKGTTAYQPAQQLLKSSQPQLIAVRDRSFQEQLAANIYQQSLLLAQQAQNFQGINQWSQAVSNWRNAIASLKRIPSGTFHHGKAQPLINSYTVALQQAQDRFQLAMRMQQTSQDLNRTCSGTPQICNYTITSNGIKVRVTPAYANTLKQTAMFAKAQGDYNAQIKVVNHVLTVGEALEAISDNARLPLEVYGPNGAAIQVHTP